MTPSLLIFIVPCIYGLFIATCQATQRLERFGGLAIASATFGDVFGCLSTAFVVALLATLSMFAVRITLMGAVMFPVTENIAAAFFVVIASLGLLPWSFQVSRPKFVFTIAAVGSLILL